MSTISDFDVLVVGAGAAGVAATARLKAAAVSVLALEAKDRVGGRAHSLSFSAGAGIDLGCSWLHSADRNAWTEHAQRLGFALDRSKPAWTRPALATQDSPGDQRAYRQVFKAFEDRLEQAARGEHDIAASTLIRQDEARWAPLLNAFSNAYNGAPFDQISVKDYAAYQPTDENWRVREGYGALISAFAADLPIRLKTPVRRIEHGGLEVRLMTDAGSLTARAIILAVSTTVLADETIVFDPPLPDKRDAAAALPLGHVEKLFLRLSDPEAYPVETMVRGRTDTADTGGYTLRPMGLPVIEGFFGGGLAAALEMEAEGAFAAFAADELAAALGSEIRGKVQAIAESTWRTDPFIRGAYSHAVVGRSGARVQFAAPVDERLFFAGEACSAHAFSTAHGAYETGIEAAEAALSVVKGAPKAAPPG